MFLFNCQLIFLKFDIFFKQYLIKFYIIFLLFNTFSIESIEPQTSMSNFILLSFLQLAIVIIYTQRNLIKDGDFERFRLSIIQPGYFIGNYSLFKYSQSQSWYRYLGDTQYFQVLHYFNTTNQGLDTINGYTDTITCQNITIEIDRAYLLQFEYLIDYPSPYKKINVTFDDATIFSAEVSTMYKNIFSTVVRSSMTLGTLCFFGIFIPGLGESRRGVIIDNVNMTEATITQSISFDIREDWQAKQLILSSDYIVDSMKLEIFNETIIKIGEVESPLLKITQGTSGNLCFVSDLDIQINQSLLTVSILISDYVYTDSNGFRVLFRTTNASNQMIQLKTSQPQILPEATNRNTQLVANQEAQTEKMFILVDFVTYISEGVNTLGLIGFTVMVFKVISFANIYILYIFLNTQYLDTNFRQNLEAFANILLGIGPISSFSQLVFRKNIKLESLKIKTSQKMSKNYETQGSLLSVINISSNLFDSCLEDFILMNINIIKILLLWFVISRFKRNKKIQKLFKNNLPRKFFEKAMLIQIISVAPIWTLTAATTLTPICEFTSPDFLTKFNQSILIILPILLIYLWFPLHLILFSTKKIKQKENQKTKFRQADQLQYIRQQDKKYIYLEKYNERIQSFQHLFFVIFGFFIGLQNPALFFVIITAQNIIIIFLFCKKREFSISYGVRVIQIIIKTVIHLSFLILFIFTQLVGFQIFEIEEIKNCSHIISMIIFYAYLCGIAFEILIISIDSLSFIFSFVKIIRQRSDQQQPQKKSNRVQDVQRPVKKLFNCQNALQNLQEVEEVPKTRQLGNYNFRIIYAKKQQEIINSKQT